MSDNEIIDVIAPLCGWVKREVFEPSFSDPRQLVSRGLKWHDPKGFQRNRPNYPNDLNAIHEAEKTLSLNALAEYADNLEKICVPVHVCSLTHWADVIMATARQRCEAFIKTICPEKWKGDA